LINFVCLWTTSTYKLPQKITELRCSINLRLPRIFPLTQHSRCHDFVSVFATYQVCRLQEYRGTVREWHRLPQWFRDQCGLNGLSDLRLACIGVLGHGVGMGRRILLFLEGGAFNLQGLLVIHSVVFWIGAGLTW